MTTTDNSLDILKMEYQICRNKIDDLDNLLKDLRFKGITIVTGFIAGNSYLLLKSKYLDVTILVSLFIIMLILQVWKYDHKYSVFLVGTVERAQEIENRLQEIIRRDIGKWYYSFSIDSDPKLEMDLCRNRLSKKLKREFKTKKGIKLSKNASLKKDNDEWNTWKITDGEEIYIIKKEDKMLNVYKEVKMLSHKLSEVYRKLPGRVAITSLFLYTLLGSTAYGILLYSAYLKQISWLVGFTAWGILPYLAGLKPFFWFVGIIVIPIFFIFLMLRMWYLRYKAEPWFKQPKNQKE